MNRGSAMDTLLKEKLYRDFALKGMKDISGRKSTMPEENSGKFWRYQERLANEPCVGVECGPTGGIYNLEFNTDG